MGFGENEIWNITRSTWSSLLGLDLKRGRNGSSPEPEGFLTGCVEITGAWEGTVALDCPMSLARRASGILFDVSPDNVTLEEMRDTLGELANIIGGNIKSLLPGPNRMSLPMVLDGEVNESHLPGSHMLAQCAFESEGKSIRVTILEK